MRYIKIVLDTEYCGIRKEKYIKTDMTDGQLSAYVCEEAAAHSEQYDWMVFDWGEDAYSYAEANDISVEEAEEELQLFYDDAIAASYWEEITKEEYEENKNNV